MGLALVSGKSILLVVGWELATYGACVAIASHGFQSKIIRAMSALVVASGISLVCISAWIILPSSELGTKFLVAGLIIKGGIFGFHFWIPDTYSGPPSHASAMFSGLMTNLPLILFVNHVLPRWEEVPYPKVLISLAAMGVVFGAISSFFHKNIKKSLSYSKVENLNFLWFCLISYAFTSSSENESILNLSKGFLVIFYLSLVNYSISKAFQFFLYGTFLDISFRFEMDENKGKGRWTGLPAWLSSMGTMSYCAMPFTLGFIAEGSFLYLCVKFFELINIENIFLFPLLIIVFFGIALGSLSHLRIYIHSFLSIPKSNDGDEEVSPSGANSLKSLMFFAFTFVVGFWFSVIFFKSRWESNFLYPFWKSVFPVAILFLLIYVFGFYLFEKMKVEKRVLWDCGSKYAKSDLSIPGTAISDPLYDSVGKYFHQESGYSRFDTVELESVHYFLDIGKYWIQKVEAGKISVYLGVSATSLLVMLVSVIYFRG
jgi:formate hydrogenlyase subunit 3/multisubunit Na+/H+ antiporter MnhD subunit